MPTTPERYAVVSCHVERPLDDAVWDAFADVQRRRPGGLSVAALLRPPDPAAGELDEERWLERAHSAAEHAPLGHHTHWTAPDHARPVAGDPGERVLAEGHWLRERGLEPLLFCGGGWYTDPGVAAACAALGYVDCTPRAARPPYLDTDAAWAELREPARVTLPGGASLAAVPTTHGLGALVRALARPRGLPERVHAYFHDTDLLDARRRRTALVALALLGRRRPPGDIAAIGRGAARVVDWAAVGRGRPVPAAGVESGRAGRGASEQA